MIKDFPNVLKSNGETNKFSSKRVITFLLALTLIVVIIARLFWGLTIEEYMFSGLSDLLIWALGFIGSEHFAGVLKQQYKNKDRNIVIESEDKDETG